MQDLTAVNDHRLLSTAALLLLLSACTNDANPTAQGNGSADRLRVVTSNTGVSIATVDAEGAVVALADGAEVAVPAGALEREVEIVVRGQASGFPPVETADATEVVAFLPHGTEFAIPVTVRVPHAGSSSTNLALYTSAPNGAWEEVSGATFESGFAVAEIMHFSFFFAGEALPPDRLNPAQESLG